MKSKYFKLKLTLLISAILVIIGTMGSIHMLGLMKNKINAEIIAGNEYETVELLKTDKKISYVDLTKYFYSENIELEKSDDEYNHIIVSKKKNSSKVIAKFDEVNGELVRVYNEINHNVQDGNLFNVIERYVIDNTMRGEIIKTIFNEERLPDLTTITLKLKEPVEIYSKNTLNNSKNFDMNLIKNTIDINNFTSQNYNYFDIPFSKTPFDNIIINNFNNSNLVVRTSKNASEVTVNVDKIENLIISGYDVYNPQSIFKKVLVNCENVQNVFVDLKELDNNIEIVNAKNVVIENAPEVSDYNIIYDIEGTSRVIKVDRFRSSKDIKIHSLKIDAKSIKTRIEKKGERIEDTGYTSLK